MSFENSDSAIKPSVDFRAAFEVMPGNSALLLANPPTYTILAVTEDFVRTTHMQREDLMGKGFFEPFPESPDDPNSTGEKNIRASLDYVISHKVPHQLAVQRYDIPNSDGTFTEHYWRPEHRPVLNQEGEVAYIIQTSVEITDQVKAKQREARIRDIEKAYNLFMQTPVIIGIVKGDKYVIELANEELLLVWDRTNEVVGKPLFEALPELQEQGFKALLDQVRITGEPFYANEFPIDLVRNGKRELRYLDFVYKPFYESSTDTVASGVFALGHDITEQVLARQKIKESEEELRLAVEAAELGTFRLDLQLNKGTTSDRIDEWFGHKVQGFSREEGFNPIHPDDRSLVDQAIDQTLLSESNSRHDVTYRVIHPTTGTIQHLRSFGKTLFNNEGKPYLILGIIQNITPQILYQKQIEESQEAMKRFKYMADHAQDPFILMREDGTFAYLNHKALDAWGYTEEEARHLRVPDVDLIFHDEKFNEAFALAQREIIPQFETLHKRKDGYIYTVEVNMGGLTLAGKPHLFAIARDISTRKQTEEALRQSNKRFELVSRATQDSIWDWDITTGQTYRGEGFEEIMDFKQTETPSNPDFWHSFVHPDDAQRIYESIQDTLQSQATHWEQEYRIQKRNGEYAYVKDRGLVVRDTEGKALRMIGAMRDISEHHYYLALEKLEREILRMNVVKETNLQKIAEYYLLQIEGLHPGMLCSILEVKNNRVYNLASPNLSPDYLNSIEGAEIGEYAGSCGTAAYLKEKVIVTDIQTDVRWTGYHDLAAKHNLEACWSHPILDANGAVIATFACYYREPKSPSVLEENTIKRTGNILRVLLESYRKEKALSESNKRYELVTRATSDAIWDWNIPEDKVYFNDAYTQLFGYDNSILSIDIAWSSHIHDEDKQRVTDSFQTAFADSSVLAWQDEYRFVRADGTIAYVHDRGIIIRDAEGRATQMVGAMLDITERKQFEATLAQREEQFRTLANSIFQLAWMADADGWIHWYNDRWYEYTGTTLEEMEGWGWEKVHHPDHIERVVAFAKEAWPKGEPWELTFPLRGKDGTYRWFLTRGVPVKDKEGKVTQWIGTNTDIDAQKQAEVLLEEKVKERTLELETKTRELEQFTYVSHHDLKEPIRKIQIFTEMIRSDSYDKLSEASKKRLDRVTDSAQRMNAALTDVLNFASLNQEEQPRQVDIGVVLTAVQTDLELLISEKNASITVSDLPTIEAVHRQIHQLFYNLLSNALKFSKPGVPPVISVTCQKLNRDLVAQHPDLDNRRSYYEFEVKDNGIGFGQNYADKIFVIFQRLHSKDAYSGTGIGLALAKKVVMKHGGKIWAESREGEGATFKIILPSNW
ncbi:PAS domain-containing protein [Telluribacter humicola]|uniref:PAS domain-containing protein n=1 Tax=Telluribacter humicola TaxID=1720261 RepID=UPI001A977EE8|nr:PAS domain-containing protein [Telluribacter humicola]